MSSYSRPLASKYDEYRRLAARAMKASRDSDVRAAGDGLATGNLTSHGARATVGRRLAVINTATQEAAELRSALANIDAMIYIEKSSHVGEHKIPGTEKTRVSAGVIHNANELHAALAKEMREAGAGREHADAMAFVMAWAAFGKSLEELIRDHPAVFAGMPQQKRLVGQWLDRAKHLRSGK